MRSLPNPRAIDKPIQQINTHGLLHLHPESELYLGLVHHDDAQGDAARLRAARRYARVDGVATECGMARGDPSRLPTLLAAHVRATEIAA